MKKTAVKRYRCGRRPRAGKEAQRPAAGYQGSRQEGNRSRGSQINKTHGYLFARWQCDEGYCVLARIVGKRQHRRCGRLSQSLS